MANLKCMWQFTKNVFLHLFFVVVVVVFLDDLCKYPLNIYV